MSRLVCTRVAYLRIPWFQIDVLRRAGHLAKGTPVALVQGQGTRARVTLVDPAARAAGLIPGMRPTKARSLAATLQLRHWDASAERAQEEATEVLSTTLKTLSPRSTLIAPGQWWLEPASPNPHTEPSEVEMEMNFASRVIQAIRDLGFLGPRLAIADSPTCAAAATRDGGRPVIRVPPSGDRAYLGRLPLHALPLSDSALGLLNDLGVHRIHTLQTMSPQALELRLGPEGRRAWELSQGHDLRRPQTTVADVSERIVLELPDGVQEVASLLFILRPALKELIAAQTVKGLALEHLGLTLTYAWGAEHELFITPSRPISDAKLLMELLRLKLNETISDEPREAPIITLVLEALRVSPQRARQSDLFQRTERTMAQAERTLVRLLGRLGKGAVTTPFVREEQAPEDAGGWATLNALEKPVNDSYRPHTPAACLRLLPSPRELKSEGLRPDQLSLDGRLLTLTQWHGPERISGKWWSAPYDRDYYWVSTAEGFALWLFRARRDKRWFLHGWLD